MYHLNLIQVFAITDGKNCFDITAHIFCREYNKRVICIVITQRQNGLLTIDSRFL